MCQRRRENSIALSREAWWKITCHHFRWFWPLSRSSIGSVVQSLCLSLGLIREAGFSGDKVRDAGGCNKERQPDRRQMEDRGEGTKVGGRERDWERKTGWETLCVKRKIGVFTSVLVLVQTPNSCIGAHSHIWDLKMLLKDKKNKILTSQEGFL